MNVAMAVAWLVEEKSWCDISAIRNVNEDSNEQSG
jgi:hypothetical protein